MSTNEIKGYVVIGKGRSAAWANNASAVDPRDTDLLEAAHTGRLYAQGIKRGACDVNGNLRDDGWLLVVGAHVDESTLDADPSVIAYCAAP